MNNFSPNMLKTFEECPQKFFLKYIKKLSLPQRSSLFEKGKKIHALASYYLMGEDVCKMEKSLNPDEKIIWELLKSNKYFKLETVETEYNLSCKIGDYWVGGRLDALIKEGGNYFILDYKTGKIPANAEGDFQTIVYLLCADKLLNRKEGYNSLKFIYLGLKENTEKEIAFGDETKTQYEAKINQICKNIDFSIKSKTFNCNKEACQSCEYKKICL